MCMKRERVRQFIEIIMFLVTSRRCLFFPLRYPILCCCIWACSLMLYSLIWQVFLKRDVSILCSIIGPQHLYYCTILSLNSSMIFFWNQENTSCLYYIKYNQVTREKQSMKETKYLYPLIELVEHGPQTSECIISKAWVLLWLELTYELLVSLPNWHASHKSFDLSAFSKRCGYNRLKTS